MRTKETWFGEIAAQPRVNGRRLEIPVTLEKDPRREVVVSMPLSKVPGFVRQVARAAARATNKDFHVNGYDLSE